MGKRITPLLILVILAIVFFWKNILGEVFYFGDNLNFFVPNKIFLVDSVKNGIFPLWNPLIFSGTPYIADLAIFPFYPGNLLFFLFSPLAALTYLAIIEVIMAGFFMYLYLGRLGFEKFLRILGAVVFMFSGSVVTHIGNISILNVIIWLPLILYFIEKYFCQKSFKYLFLAGLSLTLSFLGGHVQLFYYNGLFIFLYILFKIRASVREKIIGGFLILFVFLGLCAFQLLPFLEFAQLSTRPVSDYVYSTVGSINPVVTVRLILAQIYGRLVDGYSWGPGALIERGFADVAGYIGVLPLVFVAFVITKKFRKVKFWIISSILFLILSFGKYTPIYYLFYKLVPFFARFRNPAQFLFLYSFCAVVLSVYGLKYFIELKKERAARLVRNPLIIIGFIVIAAIGLVQILTKGWLFWQLAVRTITIISSKVNIPYYYSQEKSAIILQLFFENTTFLLVTVTLAAFLFYRFKRGLIKDMVFKLLILILIFIDLLIFSKNSLYMVKPDKVEIPQEASRELSGKLEAEERFISGSQIIPYTGLFNYWNQTMVREPFAQSRVDREELAGFKVFKKEVASLPPNIGMNSNLATVNGYGSMVVGRYANYFDPEKKSRDVNNVNISGFSDRKLDLLGVKYLVLDRDLAENEEIEVNSAYKLVFSGSFVKIYENRKSFPRAFIDNGKKVNKTIRLYQPNRVDIELDGDDGGQLVLTDVFYPGWEAFIDGRRVPIKSYKNVFRAIDVTENAKLASFLFKPKKFYLGSAISGLFFLICLVKLALLSAAKTKKR